MEQRRKDMEKNIEISILNQIYGKLLTEKQYEIINDYYDQDLSLSEIAQNNEITRQAVRDILKKGEKKLYDYEEKLKFLSKSKEQEEHIKKINEQLKKIAKTEKEEQTKKDIEKIQKDLDGLK